MLAIFSAYARFVLRYPKLCLFIALLFTVHCAYLAKDVRLNNQFAALFTIDNEANQYRSFFRQAFDADDAVLLAIIKPKTADQQFFQILHQATQDLESNPNFVRIISPTNAAIVWQDDDSVVVDPVFDEFHPLAADKLKTLLRESSLTRGNLIAEKQELYVVIAQMPTEFDRYDRVKGPAKEFQQQIEQSFSDKNTATYFAGMAFMRVGIMKLMMQDLLMLVPLTAIMVMLFSYALFRSKSVVVIAFLSSIFGVMATLGLIGLCKDDINQLSLTFPILIMVIVVANTVHFFHRYHSEISQGKTVEQAVTIVTQRIGIASLLSCFTTMIGFYTLMTANMPALFGFGFYVGTGVMLSFFGVMLIIPPLLLLTQPKLQLLSLPRLSSKLDRFTADIIAPNRVKKVCAVGALVLLLSSVAAYYVQYDYFLSGMLAPSHPQAIASRILDKHISGSLPVEISLLGEKQAFKQPENLEKALQLRQWLGANLQGHWYGLADLLFSLNQAIDNSESLPSSSSAISQLLLLAEDGQQGNLQQLVSKDYSHTRIKGRIPDIGAERLMQLQHAFDQQAKELFADTQVAAKMTGELPVYYEGMNQITVELIRSVLFALVLVVLTIWLVFRSASFAIASIFPNILPIVFGLACYAMLGESVNPLPAIALCIGIGIAVDDTIHLFARFNEEVAKGKNSQQAVLDTVREIKGALMTTSAILISGFMVFFFSAFTWNRELGMLGAILILLALLADLILTPAILSLQKSQSHEQHE